MATKKMKYYRITVKYDRGRSYDVFVKGAGITDREAVKSASDQDLFDDPDDVQYVREVTPIERTEYNAHTKKPRVKKKGGA